MRKKSLKESIIEEGDENAAETEDTSTIVEQETSDTESDVSSFAEILRNRFRSESGATDESVDVMDENTAVTEEDTKSTGRRESIMFQANVPRRGTPDSTDSSRRSSLLIGHSFDEFQRKNSKGGPSVEQGLSLEARQEEVQKKVLGKV